MPHIVNQCQSKKSYGPNTNQHRQTDRQSDSFIPLELRSREGYKRYIFVDSRERSLELSFSPRRCLEHESYGKSIYQHLCRKKEKQENKINACTIVDHTKKTIPICLKYGKRKIKSTLVRLYIMQRKRPLFV